MMKSDIAIPKEKTMRTVTAKQRKRKMALWAGFYRSNIYRTFDPERHPVIPVALHEFPECEHIRHFNLCRDRQLILSLQ